MPETPIFVDGDEPEKSDPRVCPHPSGARIITAQGFTQCAVCGKLEPADDLEQRQARKDAELGRMIREARPDLAEKPERIRILLAK